MRKNFLKFLAVLVLSGAVAYPVWGQSTEKNIQKAQAAAKKNEMEQLKKIEKEKKRLEKARAEQERKQLAEEKAKTAKALKEERLQKQAADKAQKIEAKQKAEEAERLAKANKQRALEEERARAQLEKRELAEERANAAKNLKEERAQKKATDRSKRIEEKNEARAASIAAAEEGAQKDEERKQKKVDVLGFEIGGNVTVLTGWQRTDPYARNVGTKPRGILGDYLTDVNVGPSQNTLGVFLDQAILDIKKEIKNIAAFHVEVNISPNRQYPSNSTNTFSKEVVFVNQAYIEGNPFKWDGFKLTVGRFNPNIGYDPVDRDQLNSFSYSTIHRFLVPFQITGGKATYFTRNWNWEVYVVQGIENEAINQKTIMPTYGTNLKAQWGDQGGESWVRLSGAAGPQNAQLRQWTFLGDFSGSLYVSDHFRLGFDGVYRQADGGNCGDGQGNCKYYGAMGEFLFPISRKVIPILRYDFVRDVNNGGLTGANQTIHSGTFALNWAFNRHGKFVLESRVDIQVPEGANSNLKRSITPGAGGLFSYSF